MKKAVSITVCVIGIVLIGAFLFAWYQIRPAQVRHDCSWVKQHSDAIPGRPAMTKEELIAKGIIRSCQKEIEALQRVDPTANYTLGDMSINAMSSLLSPPTDGHYFSGLFEDPLWKATSCIEDGNKVIADYRVPKNAVPAKEWYEPASKEEYNFCLHDKGL